MEYPVAVRGVNSSRNKHASRLQIRCQYCLFEEVYGALEQLSRVKIPETCLETQLLLQMGKYELHRNVRVVPIEVTCISISSVLLQKSHVATCK